jgi:glycosyltransferase involved in cell wall biosynthesis
MFSFTFYFFIVVVAIQFLYYVIVFRVFAFSKQQKNTLNNVPISVIVCAKNEQENLQKYIPILLEQNYSNFEIVLIDDASRDYSLDIMEEFEKQSSKIKLVKVENNEAFWGNKKFALTLGIKAAKFDNLLFIDADCYPNSKNWIQEMSNQFANNSSIILGYGAYEKIKGSFLNKIIRFETLFSATQYFSWAKIGKPYMGVGRNLAYDRKEFYQVNGFNSHMKIRSGDDDLFINEVSNSENTSICFSPESFTYSEPKMNFKDWIFQKRRHIATASHYKFFDKMQLSLFYFTQFSFILLSIFLMIFEFQWMIVLGIIAFRYLFTWIIVGYSASKLKEKDVMYWFPVIEITLIFSQLYFFVLNLFSKPVYWK